MKRVERGDPLLEAGLDPLPIGRRDDARDEVERENLLRAALVGVDGEGDASLEEVCVRDLPPPRELALADPVELFDYRSDLGAELAGRLVELVEGSGKCLIILEQGVAGLFTACDAHLILRL